MEGMLTHCESTQQRFGDIRDQDANEENDRFDPAVTENDTQGKEDDA